MLHISTTLYSRLCAVSPFFSVVVNQTPIFSSIGFLWVQNERREYLTCSDIDTVSMQRAYKFEWRDGIFSPRRFGIGSDCAKIEGIFRKLTRTLAIDTAYQFIAFSTPKSIHRVCERINIRPRKEYVKNSLVGSINCSSHQRSSIKFKLNGQFDSVGEKND